MNVIDTCFCLYDFYLHLFAKFSDKLIGVVYDKFGEKTKMLRTEDDKCVATIKVQISPTFWGWLFQFGNQMRILSPAELAEKQKEVIRELAEQ